MRKLSEILGNIVAVVVALVVIAAIIGIVWVAVQIFLDIINLLVWLGG